MYEITSINGATFIFSPFKGLETASLGVFLKIGSRYEKRNLKGIAHFLEHLLFKGSKNYSYRQIKREIEGRGGSLNGFTSQEYTGYYAHFLSKNLAPTLDILLDMVFNPSLRREDVERERKVILEEIKMYNDLPSSRVVSLLEKLIWQRHPLGEEVIGNFSTIERIKRKDLVKFKNSYYNSSNVIISCSGDLSKDKIIKLVKRKITTYSKENKLKTIPPSPLRGIHIKIENKNLEQTHLCLGFRSLSYFNQQRLIVDLINVILGANMSSRLFEEIRERRALCYDISTEIRKYKDSGAFIIHLGLDKEKINIALRAIFKELKKLKENKISLRELNRAKDFFIGQITIALERPQGRMFHLAENYLTLRKIYTLEEIKKEIKAIDASQIRNLSKKIFNFSNLCLSCVGEVREGEVSKIREIIRSF